MRRPSSWAGRASTTAGSAWRHHPRSTALEASLFGRAARTLRTWLGDPSLDVVVEVIEDHEPGRIDELPDGRLRVALPLRWVADVWGRDLALVAGRFSLSVLEVSVLEAGEQGILLDTVGFDLGPPRPVRIALPAD